MRKFTLACFSCITISFALQAQQFQNRIGKSAPREFGNSVTQQVDGTFLIGGNYRNTFYGKDYPAIIHLAKNGSVDWLRQLNVPNQPTSFVQYAEAVKSTTGTADGYIAIINASSSIYLVRLTNSGTVTWGRKLSNATYSSNYPLRVKPSYSSSAALPAFYILATHFSGLGEVVIKTNSAGIIQWQKRITHPTNGYSYVFRDMQATKDTGCVVTGYISGGGTSNPVIFKFSPTGSVTFGKSYDFFGTPYSGGFGISEFTSGGYVVTGDDGGSDDNLTFKVTSTGAITWGNKYTNTATNDLTGRSVVTDGADNIIIAGANYPGSSPNLPFLMKLNSSGTIIFSKEFDDFYNQFNSYNDADVEDLKLTSTGYCFVSTASPSNTLADIFVVHTNTSGNVTGACTPASVTNTRVSPDFLSVSNATYTVANESLINTSVAISSPKITSEELKCATVMPPGVIKNELNGNLTAYTANKSVIINYTLPVESNNTYDVKLVNLNGNVVASRSLKPNQPIVIDNKQFQNGMYVVTLSLKGIFVTQQKTFIGQ